jgi:uncharacterized protein DUF1566
MTPIKLTKTMSIEVYHEDSPKLMTWIEADKWAKSIGDGWRLPTREELLFIYENRDKVPGLKTTYSDSDFARWYWSCSEHRDDPSCVYVVGFTDGLAVWLVKGFYRLSSRLVRAELPA